MIEKLPEIKYYNTDIDVIYAVYEKQCEIIEETNFIRQDITWLMERVKDICKELDAQSPQTKPSSHDRGSNSLMKERDKTADTIQITQCFNGTEGESIHINCFHSQQKKNQKGCGKFYTTHEIKNQCCEGHLCEDCNSQHGDTEYRKGNVLKSQSVEKQGKDKQKSVTSAESNLSQPVLCKCGHGVEFHTGKRKDKLSCNWFYITTNGMNDCKCEKFEVKK